MDLGLCLAVAELTHAEGKAEGWRRQAKEEPLVEDKSARALSRLATEDWRTTCKNVFGDLPSQA